MASTAPDLTPKRTLYRGRTMRSRLEARWAYFFDRIGIPWEYEVEPLDLTGVRSPLGFALQGRENFYLPDFYLPDQRLYLEIKPEFPGELARERAARAAKVTDQGLAIAYGPPWAAKFLGFTPQGREVYRLRLFQGHLDDAEAAKFATFEDADDA